MPLEQLDLGTFVQAEGLVPEKQNPWGEDIQVVRALLVRVADMAGRIAGAAEVFLADSSAEEAIRMEGFHGKAAVVGSVRLLAGLESASPVPEVGPGQSLAAGEAESVCCQAALLQRRREAAAVVVKSQYLASPQTSAAEEELAMRFEQLLDLAVVAAVAEASREATPGSETAK